MANPFEDDTWPEAQRTQVRYDPDAPFVVDLPDGQKLLVGDLPEGTIIEVAAWRGTHKPDSRTTRLLLGVKKDAPAQPEELVVGDVPEEESDLRRRKVNRRKTRNFRVWIGLLVTVVVVAIAGIAFYLSPLELVHPSQGVDIGFGPASSSLVVTSPVSNIEAGQMLVANSPNGVILGRVSAVSPTEVLLQTATGYSQVPNMDVTGAAVLLIPFLGYIF